MIKKKKLFPYIHEYTDSTGQPRVYIRKPGVPRVALPWPVGTEAFKAAYYIALAGETKPGKSKTVAGTINALMAQYYASPAFTSKATATQRNYKSILEPFRLKHGDKPVALFQVQHIDAIIGEVAAKSTAQAKNLRKRLFMLMSIAVKKGYRKDNPMLMADQVKHETHGYETWTDDDIAKFRAHWPDETPQRIAFEILLYTGLRRADAVKIGRQHIQGHYIVMKTKKSRETVELNIPIHDDFRAVLNGIKHNHLNLIVTAYGAARSEKAFTNWIIQAARDAHLPPHRSPHGLRKAACRLLAEAGCSALEIMSITGHKNLKELETYCAAANQKKLANSAIAKLKGVS